MKTNKKIVQNGVQLTLHQDGMPCTCPYQPALAVPGKFQGTVDLQYTTCSNRCALFQVREKANGKGHMVHLHCGSSMMEDVEIETIKPKLMN